MQQIATNQFIKNANNFGNSYEKQIANAFEEIQQNEQEIKESINALYKGPESFVNKANDNLKVIEEQFNAQANNIIKKLKVYKTNTLILCIGAVVSTLIACLIMLLIFIFSASIYEFFNNAFKDWSAPFVFLVIITIMVLFCWLAYCFGKGK